jgi:NAD(P)H-flavin reductase
VAIELGESIPEGPPPTTPAGSGEPDYRSLEQSIAAIAPVADKAVAYFYSLLFTAHPQLRSMFPLAMDEQRGKFLYALSRCIGDMQDSRKLARYLGQLARDHRKYGVQDKHYPVLAETLAASIPAFAGTAWDDAGAAAWRAAVEHICTVMAAAASDVADEPAWWIAEVTSHDRRGPDLAVLTIQPSPALPFRAGQYLTVQVTQWPRVWRPYSIGNAPRPDGSLDLHVRAVPGGLVSNALVQQTQAGDTLVLGPARGEMAASSGSQRDLLCLAGGTGLAPIKAIIEELAGTTPGGPSCSIELFVGARQAADLYDLPDLRRLEAANPGLRVITAVPEGPGAADVRGSLPDAVRRCARLQDREVYVCGPRGMVRSTLRLLAHRIPSRRIHYDTADY